MANISPSIDIEVKCESCGRPLNAAWDQYKGGHLDVSPCEKCMGEMRDEGYKSRMDEEE